MKNIPKSALEMATLLASNTRWTRRQILAEAAKLGRVNRSTVREAVRQMDSRLMSLNSIGHERRKK